MKVPKFRGILYAIAKFLGDFQAVSSGNSKKMTNRVGRRVTGKVVGKKVMRNLFK